MSIPVTLPGLTVEESAHAARVAARLHEAIAAAGGWVSFARYMQLALYEPGLGYYSAGAAKLGPAGDFITAPEVAPVFSRCVANQCVEVLRWLGGGRVLELGAGSGAMAAGMLAEMARQDCLPQEYVILDVSADLRERQRATIAAQVPTVMERVRWLEEVTNDIYSRWRDAEPPISTTILAAPGQIEMHLSLRIGDEHAGIARLDRAVAEVCAVLGNDVFSVDGRSLDQVVGALLRQSKWRIGVAEWCTGGLVASP